MLALCSVCLVIRLLSAPQLRDHAAKKLIDLSFPRLDRTAQEPGVGRWLCRWNVQTLTLLRRAGSRGSCPMGVDKERVPDA